MPETAVIETEPEFVPPVDALDEPVGPSPLDQREAVMEEVAATRLEELREDGVDIPPADEAPLPPEDGEAAAPGDGAEPMREVLPGEPLYTVKVDGVERQVPLSEITASYQIQGAAQNRLVQANQILRQARQMEQGVLDRAAAPQVPDIVLLFVGCSASTRNTRPKRSGPVTARPAPCVRTVIA